MAENKKSFVLYSDARAIFEQLDNNEAGLLIKHIFSYVNDENPILEDRFLKLAFEPIKLQLKRDLIKWNEIKEKRSLAGIASAESKKKSTKSTSVKSVQQTSTKSTVNVNDIVIVTSTPAFNEFLLYAKEKEPSINPAALKNKYDAWIENGWRNGNDKPIKNWKSALLQTLPYLPKTEIKKFNPLI